MQQNKLLMDMMCKMRTELNNLKQEMKPVVKFFNAESRDSKPAVKRVSKKKKDALDDEEHLKMLERKILAELIAEQR